MNKEVQIPKGDAISAISVVNAREIDPLTGHIVWGIWRNVAAARRWLRTGDSKVIRNAIEYVIIIEFDNGEAAIWVDDGKDDEIQIEDWAGEFDQTFGDLK